MREGQGLSEMEPNPEIRQGEPQGVYRQLSWDDETVARFWRWQSQFPEEYFTNQFGDRIARTLAPWIRSGRGSILDYGCGLGFLPRHLAALGCKVWATDFSKEAVEITNGRNSEVVGFEGAHTVAEMRSRGQRFSRIISIEVVEHLDARHIASFFEAIRDMLASDGLVIITTPNEEHLERSQIYCPCCDHVFHRYQHVRSFSATSLDELVRAHGLEPIKTFATDFSRRSWWHPKQIVRDLIAISSGASRRQPHLACIARRA